MPGRSALPLPYFVTMVVLVARLHYTACVALHANKFAVLLTVTIEQAPHAFD